MKQRVSTLGALSAVFQLRSFDHAHAASDSKVEITALEHKLIAATNVDETMAFLDEKEIMLYDYVVPLQYAGATAVHANLAKFFSNAKNVKGEFVALQVVADRK